MKKLNCILLIDDDDPTNFWNQFLLTKRECAEHIVVTKSGAEALEYQRHCMEALIPDSLSHLPDLIFLDLNMPRMNGWEFLERYRRLPWLNHKKPIMVILTTSLFPEDVERARTMPDIAGFENKPLVPEVLEKIWKTHFPDINPE